MLGLKAKLHPFPHPFPTTYRKTSLKNTIWENGKQQAGKLIECSDQRSLVDNRAWQNKEMQSCNKTSKMAFSYMLDMEQKCDKH